MKKIALLALVFSLPLFAQTEIASQDKIAKFKEAESRAPKGYPTLFVVSTASSQSGRLMGDQACQMNLTTLGKVYFVTAQQGFVSACKVFTPGTVMFGKVHNALLGQIIDLLDATEAKPKKRTYLVQDTSLVDPANQ